MKKNNKDLIILIILVPIFLWLAFFISSRVEGNLPAYSIENKAGNGLSVFYTALQELDYPVSRVMVGVDGFADDGVQIIAQNGSFDVYDNDIKEWVGNGGILVYLSDKPFLLGNLDPTAIGKKKDTDDSGLFSGYGGTPEISDNLNIYEYGDGIVISTNVQDFTNMALKKDTAKAYSLAEELSDEFYGSLYFNEFYMYSDAVSKSLWSQTPFEIKLIFYQLILALMAFFYYRGKRFGKPVPLYDEVERSENEYLHSVAALYIHAKCYDLILESYYKNFLAELKCNHADWLEYWKKENLGHADKARTVFEFMDSQKLKAGRKEYIKIITMLDQLKTILHKRSGIAWKTMVRTR